MARLIDTGLNPENPSSSYVFKMGGALVLLAAVGFCCALVCQFYASRASQGFGTELRNEMFKKINTLSYKDLDGFGTASLITRITNDIGQLQLAVAMLIRLVIRAPFLIIGSVIMAMTINLKLSVVFIITAPLIALIIYTVMSRSVPFYRVIQQKLDKISLITSENLEGTRVIRAFSGVERQNARFDAACEDYTDSAVNVGMISALMSPLNYIVLNLAVISILWFGGKLVNSGEMTKGEIIAFVGYITQIQLALVVVANLVVIFTKASASAARVNEILSCESSLTFGSLKSVTEGGDNAITMENVSFSYGGEISTLENINLTVRHGETVGIIGGTGSGKTTLINLIMRFYDADCGKILIEGEILRDYSSEALRKYFGIVPQKSVMFSGTVRENLKWSKSDATDEEIYAALKAAQAYDFVSELKGGLDYKINEGGKNLSGGQKQRLAIARALIGKPKVLILDDSSSALDYATEAALRQALGKLSPKPTILIVSQRAASVMHADKIVVIDDGKIVGTGTHGELLSSCEIYREICSSQGISYAEGGGGR